MYSNESSFQLAPELAHNIALPIAFTILTIMHIVFGELAPRMSSQNAMILSLFDFKESMTGHKILSHNHGPKDVPKGIHTNV